MKKLRLIPLLSLAALLSACSLFGGKAKEPKFSKEGDEVTYEKFQEQYSKAYMDSELYDTDSKLGDRSLKGTASYSSTDLHKRGKKEINKEEDSYTVKGEAQFDYDNLVAKSTAEIKRTSKESSPEGTGSSTQTMKSEEYYQFTKIDGTKYLVEANAKTQVYSPYRSVSSSSDEKDVFDLFVRSNFSSYSYMFGNYIPNSKEEAKDYLFYNNDDVLFTIVYNEDDEEDVSYGTVKTKSKIKVQIDLTDGKQAIRVSAVNKTETSYSKDYNSYLDGDVVSEENVTYVDYSISSKDVNVKEVNLDDYTLNKNNGYII